MTKVVLLEVLIPAYKRPQEVLIAAVSVVGQVIEHSLQQEVSVRVVDDASPGFSCRQVMDSFGGLEETIEVSGNHTNLGMSRNIYHMVASSKAEFCTVLTDDDWIIDGALIEIVEQLRTIVSKREIGGLFTPRYSYLDTGELHCVECRPFSQARLVKGGSVPAIKYARNGFILTGFIFRPNYFAQREWADNVDNAFFPIINLGIVLFRYDLIFIDREWFHHTVLNTCHWEDWGAERFAQEKRLYKDYMEAFYSLARYLRNMETRKIRKIAITYYELANYLGQLSRSNLPLVSKIIGLSEVNRRSPAFMATVLIYPVSAIFHSALRLWRFSVRKFGLAAESRRFNIK